MLIRAQPAVDALPNSRGDNGIAKGGFAKACRLTFPVLVSVWAGMPLTGQCSQGVGAVSIQVMERSCSPNPRYGAFRLDDLTANRIVELNVPIRNGRLRADLEPGRYIGTWNSGTCTMDVDVAVFPAIARHVFAIAVPSGTIEHGDYYFIGYDSVALKLPFPFASIKAVTSDNHELPVQTEGAYAFIDRIPKGSYICIQRFQ